MMSETSDTFHNDVNVESTDIFAVHFYENNVRYLQSTQNMIWLLET